MTLDELDQLLRRLRDAAQRIGDNLLDLELDQVRMTLDQTRLEGDSEARWRVARDTLAQLWQWLNALTELLARAAELRGTRARISNPQCLELTALLTGQSITFRSDDIPVHERELLGGAVATARCAPEELLTRMAAAFDAIKTVVAAVHEAWETFQPRVAALHAALEPLGRPADLQAMTAALGERLASDPLSVLAAEVAEVEAAIQRRGELPAEVERLRTRLEQARAAVLAGQVAHAEVTVKIARVDLPEPLPEAVLEGALEAIDVLARDGERADLDRCTAQVEGALEQAERVADACRAPLARRNELRGLLDAYRGKARRLGVLEDRELDALHETAHLALHTAPTDLTDATRLVRRYGDALSSGPEVRR